MPVRNPAVRHPLTLTASAADRWRALLVVQHGVVDTAQLAEVGIGRDAITAEVDAHRWQWLLPRVYATFTGPAPREARIVAALRYGGAAAVLSHRTAAERWHLLPVADGPVHITVPYGPRRSRTGAAWWCIVHGPIATSSSRPTRR